MQAICKKACNLVFAHIPFVVNRTFNATPPERLQQLLSERLSFKAWKTYIAAMVLKLYENKIFDVH